jgi:hypothetical protein
MKRICVGCGKLIEGPHFRVLEENTKVSFMITFCSRQCMLGYYNIYKTFSDQAPDMNRSEPWDL